MTQKGNKKEARDIQMSKTLKNLNLMTFQTFFCSLSYELIESDEVEAENDTGHGNWRNY